MTYYIARMTDLGFSEAIEKVTEELKNEGFGVITEINVKETLKKKLDLDFFTILKLAGFWIYLVVTVQSVLIYTPDHVSVVIKFFFEPRHSTPPKHFALCVGRPLQYAHSSCLTGNRFSSSW